MKGYREVKKVLKDGSVRVYRYATATGERLEGSPESWRFKDDVRRASNRGPTVGDLLKRYRGSMRWRELAPSTKEKYERQMLIWRHEEDIPLKDLQRTMLSEMRDELLDTPGIAHQFVGFAKMLFNYAIDEGLMDASPASRLKRPKLGTIKRWPDNRIDGAIAALPPHMATICMLALYTGQRGSDIVKMKWSHYNGSTMSVSQAKTGMEEADERLIIPVHPALRDHLDGLQRDSEWIVLTQGGKPWDPADMRSRARVELDRIGMQGYSLHGLRKSAASRMAEAGCSSKEIAAILGHKTLAMVELYTKEADQARLAVQAMDKLVQARTSRPVSA